MKTGRNDPCPCGSGKKYKHCCLNPVLSEPGDPADLAWRRMRRVLEGYPAEMLRFVKNAYGPEAIYEAWEEFTLFDKTVFSADTPHMQVFMPWFFHHWSPDAAETSVRDRDLHEVVPTRAYLRKKAARLDPLLRGYLEACVAAPFTFYDILRSDPGRGFRLRKIMTGAEQEIAERSASKTAQEGDILFGQVAEAGAVVLLEACAPYFIKPIHKPRIIELRRRLAPKDDLFGRELLREHDVALRGLYFELVALILDRPLPKLQNTDGEPLSLQRLVFDIDSPQQAFDALKHLALDQTEEDLLEDAKPDAGGALRRVSFDWKKAGNRVHESWNNTVLGKMEIDGKRLTAEVNSQERAATLRGLIEKALGERARHRATRIQSVGKLLSEARSSGGAGKPEADREQQALAELPEVKAKIAEMMEQHYASWVNQKIPALGNRTPLEAVKDQDGREMVEALVLQIERDGRSMAPPLDAAIVRRLRERLGLTD